ncbi:MAG: choice-of-anchor J domain-containing protein, partial [Bacteroidaceae bacterium]|nr:choice-of-anchor J domain-containing protein [Bacteroidaceae bacterium]
DPWEGDLVELGNMLIVDNIHITDFYQNDLAIEVAAPQSVVAGKSASVSVTVSNEGENVARGFSVQLTAGEKELLNVTPNLSLASFKSWTYKYDFETSILDEAGDVEIVARVIYDADEKTENNEAQTVITILEPMAPVPSDLVVEKHDSNLSLSWTAPDVDGVMRVTEDFEDTSSFPEFSLGGITDTNHSGAFGDWKLYDGNGVLCYSFNEFDVPNLGNPMAWMVFKPAYLSKEIGEAYAAHSGSQLLLSTCAADGDPIPGTDHWLISPELKGNEQNISFFVRVITDSYGDEGFDVLYSTTDAEVGSFEVLDNVWLSDTEWKECNYSLPEGTKYFAIRHSSTDIFGLMVDDITFERGATAPVGYNIYVDGKKVGSATDTSFDLSGADLTSSEHTIAVTAVYAGGMESSPITTVLDITTGIDVIAMMGESVDVYTTDGRLVRRQATSLDGLKGMYMIGNKKVLVK